MSNYFSNFPKVLYDINRGQGQTVFDQPVNIMVRLGVVAETLNNIFHYYEYVVKETETPEILAENYYGDAELHWLILLTNNIVDPFYDWPLDYRSFINFIENKYGSIENAQTTYIKWQRIYKTVDTLTGKINVMVIPITEDDYVDSLLPTDEGSGSIYTIGNNSVTIYEYKTRTLAYDVENELNEKRRNIKLIKKDYLSDIQALFLSILNKAGVEPNSLFERRLT
jgi:hypothetical protein